MRIDVISIFPAYLDALQLSLTGKAQASGLDWNVEFAATWNAFALVYLGLTWAMIVLSTPRSTQHWAR